MLVLLVLWVLWPIGSPELQTCDQVFTADDTILASQTYETESGATGTAYVIRRDVLLEDDGGHYIVIVSDDCEVLVEERVSGHYLSDGSPHTANVEYIQYERIAGQETIHISIVTDGGGRYTDRALHGIYVLYDEDWVNQVTLALCPWAGTAELRTGDNPDSFYVYYEEDRVCDPPAVGLEYGVIEVRPNRTTAFVESGEVRKPFWYTYPRWFGYVFCLAPILTFVILILVFVHGFLSYRRRKKSQSS